MSASVTLVYLPLFLAYFIPFVIASVMPDWRSLSVLGLAFGGLIGWALLDIYQTDLPGGVGLGQPILLAFIASAGFGLLGGVLTRSVKLWFPSLGARSYAGVSVYLCGFAAIPVLVAAWLWLGYWQKRSPSEACLGSTFYVELANQLYELPAAPLFQVEGVDEGKSSEVEVYYFGASASLRHFCAIASNSERPFKAAIISISFDRMKQTEDSLVRAFCQLPSSSWVRDICRPAEGGGAQKYPTKAYIYSPDQYDHRRRLATDGGSYRQLIASREEAKTKNLPIESQRTGIFDIYANGYWVVHNGTWKNIANEPFTFHCKDAGGAGRIYCRTTYALNEAVQVSYEFYARKAEIELEAKAIDRNMIAVISDLSSRNQID